MSDEALQGTALVLMLLALPLISIGTWNDVDALWWIGLGVLVLGALIPPVARYVGDDGGAGDGERDVTEEVDS